MREDFIHNNRRIVPHVNIFYAYSWNLGAQLIQEWQKKTSKLIGLTSAIIILRNAFATDASTPTISKSTEVFDSLWILTCKFYTYE